MRRLLWLVLAVLVVVEPAPTGGDQDDRQGVGGDGRVLRVGVTPLGSLDPAQARSIEQLLVADQLFDSLTSYDPATLEPRPSLAARWESSADQRQWTFFLRGGVTFADGRPISAADVKYSLERVARRGSGSPGAELLQLVSGYGAFRNDAPDLAGIAAPAPDVVQVTLDEPWGVLASVLASPVLGVVPRESVEAQPPAPPFADMPMGSGPFRIARRTGAVVSLLPSAGAKTALSGLELVQHDTFGDAYRSFVAGQLDWARVPPEEVESAGRRYGDGAFRPYVASLFYGFNMASPKLADPRFREAIVRGIDRRAVVAAVYHGTVEPSDVVVLEGVPGHQPGACRRCEHDRGRARALLAEAFPPGGPTPPEVNLDYDADPSQEAMARAIQASLEQIGVPVALRPRPIEQYDDALSGQQEVFRLGWIGSYPSPDAFLSPLFGSGSPNNLIKFADPAVDEQLRAARSEPDPARRITLFQEAERAILDKVPVIPIAQFQLHTVVSDRVQNLRTTSLGTFDASVVSVAEG